MLKLKDTQHREITFWGMAFIAGGLPLSVFLVSIGSFILAGNWLLEGQYRKRLVQFFKDPLSLAVISVFLIHCIGMVHTENLAQGLKELRIKLPILLLPLLLFTSKLPNKKRQQDLLLLFVVACIVGTVFGTARYFEVFGGELINKRHISIFISHIRFGLMLTFAFFILLYFLYTKWREWSIAEKLICLLSMAWLLWFLVIMEAITAYLSFAVVLLFSLILLFFRKRNQLIQTAAIGLIVILGTASVFYFKNVYTNRFQEIPIDQETLTVRTLNGNYYSHQKDVRYRENGHRVWNFVCWEELKKEWPTKSKVDFDAMDQQGQPIKFTAIRYLTSKGLLKDSVGLHHLNEKDIAHIEEGYTNYLYTSKMGVSRRFDQFLWAMEEFSLNRNANNSSTFQRWVYMQVGWSIFKENLLFGVGTGDVFDSYKQAYLINDHGLEQRFQNISHNQFLTIGIAFGLVGFVWFLISLLYPVVLYRNDYLYAVFIVLMLVSFLTDNTFDRQSGVTLFAFFNAFLIVRREFAEAED